MTEAANIIEAVKSEEWRNTFLSLVSGVEESQELTNNINRAFSSGRLAGPQNSVIKLYEKKALLAARQYYNNAHLLAFWKWYNKKLDWMVDSGQVSSEFPVFYVAEGLFPGALTIKPYLIDFFQNHTYERLPSKKFTYRHTQKSGKDGNDPDKNDAYVNTIGQLHLLNEIVIKSTTFFYYNFLLAQKNNKSVFWDYYKIHKYLDQNLYVTSEGKVCGAPFEHIFFSSNINELEVYLYYCKANNHQPSILEVSDFLDRQRKYYLSLAIVISLEENAFLNTNRDLLYYDPDKRVTVMPKLKSKQYKYFHKELVLKAGFSKMDGCPFAQSKGVSENALVEVFTQFDKLMLKIIEGNKEAGGIIS